MLGGLHRITRALSDQMRPPTHPHPGPQEHHEDAHHEPVGRDREDLAGLLHPPQVDHHQHRDETDRDAHRVRTGRGQRRSDRRHPGHHRHRHRQHVIHQQRRRGHQPSRTAQVLVTDDVGARGGLQRRCRAGGRRSPAGRGALPRRTRRPARPSRQLERLRHRPWAKPRSRRRRIRLRRAFGATGDTWRTGRQEFDPAAPSPPSTATRPALCADPVHKTILGALQWTRTTPVVRRHPHQLSRRPHPV